MIEVTENTKNVFIEILEEAISDIKKDTKLMYYIYKTYHKIDDKDLIDIIKDECDISEDLMQRYFDKILYLFDRYFMFRRNVFTDITNNQDPEFKYPTLVRVQMKYKLICIIANNINIADIEPAQFFDYFENTIQRVLNDESKYYGDDALVYLMADFLIIEFLRNSVNRITDKPFVSILFE